MADLPELLAEEETLKQFCGPCFGEITFKVYETVSNNYLLIYPFFSLINILLQVHKESMKLLEEFPLGLFAPPRLDKAIQEVFSPSVSPFALLPL